MLCPICVRWRKGPGMYLCGLQIKIHLHIEVMLILLFVLVVHTKYSSFLVGLP
jgi:hypothetical protein